MWGCDPRSLLLRAVLLDWLGQLLILLMILVAPDALSAVPTGSSDLEGQRAWLVFSFLLYPLLGWLFGGYTVLRWRQLALPVLLQRLLLTNLVTLMVVAIARWLINPGEEVWLVDRRVQFLWLGLLFVWSLLVRVGLRRGVLMPDRPRVLVLAGPDDQEAMLMSWRRVPQRERLELVTVEQLQRVLSDVDRPLLVALAPRLEGDPRWAFLEETLETVDPRQVRVVSPLSLFEQQQERLPPAFLPEGGLTYDDLPWAAAFSVQAQLKRVADLVVAGGLLLLSMPFVVLAAVLIWLEDRGPVLYVQWRSGWLGRPFRVFKLRTMSVQPEHAPVLWTQPGDQRITRVGLWLRRLRFDELPQLLNVLSGEMSLIGPRPERPELEHELERHIPHYRKRHWMRPGLSGWAQVCAPYASSIDDSDLKLSYDLYYLRHFSTWLDLVILFRTIKTVLKAGGR